MLVRSFLGCLTALVTAGFIAIGAAPAALAQTTPQGTPEEETLAPETSDDPSDDQPDDGSADEEPTEAEASEEEAAEADSADEESAEAEPSDEEATEAAEAPDPYAAVGVDEIVVSATRREESIQDVPISMQALGRSLLDDAGLTDFQRIQQFVPNLIINPVTDSRSTQIRIRGIGSVGNNAGIDPSVGVFIDGVYQGRAGMSTADLLDVERVEVLRGPQGTLYGKNTAAGAINIFSMKPIYDFENRWEAVFGKYEQYEGRAMMNFPIIDQHVATRVSAFYNTRDGFDKNGFNGRRLNDALKMGIKSRTLIDVTDQLHFLVTGDYSYENTKCCVADISTYKGADNEYVDAVAVLFGAVSPAIDREGLTFNSLANTTGVPLPKADENDRLLFIDAPIRNLVKIGGVAVEGAYEFLDVPLISDSSLEWIGAWRHFDNDSEFDGDFSGYDAVRAGTEVDLDQYSVELRLVSPGDTAVTYQAGFYFYYQTMNTTDSNGIREDLANSYPLLAPVFNVGDNNHETTTYATYGQATWNINDLFALTGGLRYTYEKKKRVGTQVCTGMPQILCAIPAPPLLGPDDFRDESRDDSNVQGTAKFLVYPYEDVMLYTSFANGFKSGGFNQLRVRPGVPAEFDEEDSYNFELGTRTSWLDRMITFNMTGFYTIYDDFQAQTFDGQSINVRNAGKLRSYGFESEITLAPAPGLIISSAIGFNIAKYKTFDNGDQTALQRWRETQGNPAECGNPDTAFSCTQDLSGRTLDQAPRWTISTFAQYDWPTPGWPTILFLRAEYAYRSSRYLAQDLDPLLKESPTDLVNLRGGIRHRDNHWEIIGWAQNLGNERWNVAGFDVPTLSGFAKVNAPPRQYGVTVRLGF